MWYTYILQCSDYSFYVGLTNDVKDRVKEHNQGFGAKYTKSRTPVTLLYVEEYTTQLEASKREREIKKLSRRNKIKLINYGSGIRVSLASDV